MLAKWLATCYIKVINATYTFMSPSQHRTGRKQFLLRIPDELYIKFRKFAEAIDSDMSDILLAYIVKSTADITLTESDYELLKTKARGRKS